MEALYMKLYEKYSKLKNAKESEIDQFNKEQEVKFMKFVSAAETLIEHLTAENKRLTEEIDELRNEVVSQRRAKDQEIIDFQERWMEETEKNQQLSAENERLKNLLQERISSRNRSDQPEEQHVNSGLRSPTVSCGQTDESPMRMTRKRARLFQETNTVTTSPTVGHVQQLVQKDLSTDQSKRDHSKAECCQGIVVDGGAYKCMHGLLECLTGMKVSVPDQPDGKCIRFAHQSSGYSFSLTWLNTSSVNEGELMYDVASLGTFANVAHEWMRETIIFGMNMCPVFFERLSQVINRR